MCDKHHKEASPGEGLKQASAGGVLTNYRFVFTVKVT